MKKVPKPWQRALVQREAATEKQARDMQSAGLVVTWDRPGYTLRLTPNGLALAERFAALGVT